MFGGFGHGGFNPQRMLNGFGVGRMGILGLDGLRIRTDREGGLDISTRMPFSRDRVGMVIGGYGEERYPSRYGHGSSRYGQGGHRQQGGRYSLQEYLGRAHGRDDVPDDERYAPDEAPVRGEQPAGRPMDIRPEAQRRGEARELQRQGRASADEPAPATQGAEPTPEQLKAIERQLAGLSRVQVLGLQTQLEQAGFGASTDAARYSRVDGVAKAKTSRAMFDFAQSQGLDGNNVQASMQALRTQASQGPIRGGERVGGMDDVRQNPTRHAAADYDHMTTRGG